MKDARKEKNMMTIREMEIAKMVAKMVGVDSSEVVIGEREKNNGVMVKCVTVQRKESGYASPVVYVDDLFRDLDNGKIGLKQAAVMIEERLIADGEAFESKCDLKLDAESLLDRCFVTIVGTEKNRKRLADVPHIDICDMSVQVRANVEINGKEGTFVVTNRIAEMHGVSNEELLDRALKNTLDTARFRCRDMRTLFIEDFGMPDRNGSFDPDPEPDENALYVVTNDNGMYGASVLAYPDLIDEYARKIGGDVYILPSSVHEVIMVRKRLDVSLEGLRDLVKFVNGTELRPEDVLTDTVYEYTVGSKEVRVA